MINLPHSSSGNNHSNIANYRSVPLENSHVHYKPPKNNSPLEVKNILNNKDLNSGYGGVMSGRFLGDKSIQGGKNPLGIDLNMVMGYHGEKIPKKSNLGGMTSGSENMESKIDMKNYYSTNSSHSNGYFTDEFSMTRGFKGKRVRGSQVDSSGLGSNILKTFENN